MKLGEPIIAICVAAAVPCQAAATDLRVLSPGATEGVLRDLIPRFEATSHHRVSVSYGPAGSVANRVRMGESVDAVISSESEADALRRDGFIADASQSRLAKVGIGIFVKKGAARPDIFTPESFMTALRTARSIAYGDPALGGSASILVHDLLGSLDPSGSIAAKVKLVPTAKPLVDLIVKGDADFGFQPVSQIDLDDRIDHVGPVPELYQHYTVYVVSMVTLSPHASIYDAFVKHLTSSELTGAWLRRGFASR